MQVRRVPRTVRVGGVAGRVLMCSDEVRCLRM